MKAGGGQNLHLKDTRQHPAQDRACCTHTRRVSPRADFHLKFRVPICGQSGNGGLGLRAGPISRFPIPSPAESGIGGSLRVPRFPAKSGVGGTGIGDFRACSDMACCSSPKARWGRPSNAAEIQAPWHAAAEQQLSSCQHEPVTRSSSLRLPLSLSHRSGRRLASSRCTQPGGVRPPGNKPLGASHATGGPFTALPRKPPIPTGIVSAQTPDTAWTGPPEPSQESCMVFHTASRPFA